MVARVAEPRGRRGKARGERMIAVAGADRKALFCIVKFDALTGSEMVLLELAEALIAEGWSVTVLAATHDPEFVTAEVDPRIIVTSKLEDVDLRALDLVFAQQMMGGRIVPALARAIHDLSRWPLIVFMHLSTLPGMATPGPFAEELLADEIWCNSPKTRDSLIGRLGPWLEKARLFCNPAPLSFAQVASSRLPDERLRRILAVSNHLPEELITALDLLESKGITVTRCGEQSHQTRVTPETIAAHDAVITIGKTVQYALRARKPVYCYDHYGGPGWLDATLLDAAAHWHFSGRSHPQMRDAETLAVEIETGFANAAAFAAELEESRLMPFALEIEVSDLMERASTARSNSDARLSAVIALLEDPVLCGRLQHEEELTDVRIAHYLASRHFVQVRDRLKAQVKRLQDKAGRLSDTIERLRGRT